MRAVKLRQLQWMKHLPWELRQHHFQMNSMPLPIYSALHEMHQDPSCLTSPEQMRCWSKTHHDPSTTRQRPRAPRRRALRRLSQRIQPSVKP